MSLRKIEKTLRKERILNKLRIPLIIAGVLAVIFIYNNIEFYDPCVSAERMYNLKFDGTVKEKVYQNWNHGMHFLKITDQSEEDVIFSTYDENRKYIETNRSYIWEILDVNDHIRKDSGEFIVEYKKAGTDKWIRSKVGYKLCK